MGASLRCHAVTQTEVVRRRANLNDALLICKLKKKEEGIYGMGRCDMKVTSVEKKWAPGCMNAAIRPGRGDKQ